MSRPVQPAWMPPLRTVGLHPAGRDWDAIVVPQTLGLDALMVIDHGTELPPGPVIWDARAAEPRLYFLVAAGTAVEWAVPGTRACGKGSFVAVPGPDLVEPPDLYWLCPPDPDNPHGLVDVAALREALTALGAAA